MKKLMKFGKYEAVINFDPEISMYRGEFTGLNGGADFYSSSLLKLREEGEMSLRVFLECAKEKEILPKR